MLGFVGSHNTPSAPITPPWGVKHLTPLGGVPAGHNWLTPQIGVVLTPPFYSVGGEAVQDIPKAVYYTARGRYSKRLRAGGVGQGLNVT